MGEGKHDSWWLGAFPTSGGEEPPLSHNSKVFRKVIMNYSLHAPVHTRLGGTKPTLAYHGDSAAGLLIQIRVPVLDTRQCDPEQASYPGALSGKIGTTKFFVVIQGLCRVIEG